MVTLFNSVWITSYLLDKNGNVSRLKKQKYLTPAILEEMRLSCGFSGEDVNSIIYANLHGISDIPRCICGAQKTVDSEGKSREFCCVSCANSHVSTRISEAQRKAQFLRGDEIAAKRRKTNLARYGVEHPLQIPGKASEATAKGSAKRKFTLAQNRQKCLTELGLLPQQLHLTPEIIARLNDKVLLHDLFYTQLKSLSEIADILGCSASTVTNKVKEWGWPKRNSAVSAGENQVYSFICSLVDPALVIRRDRKTFSNRWELDILIPSKNLAIEYHGIYWHSLSAAENAIPENRSKHQRKHLDCAEKGIKLIQIFEDEWRDKRSILESMLTNALGLSTKVGARKAEIREITTADAAAFFSENHLAGSARADIAYGAFLQDKLVCAMSFGKPRFSKNHDWEIIRFASSKGLNLVGAGQRLLNAFSGKHTGTILTYADLRIGNGGVYNKMGFTQTGITRPGYRWILGVKSLSRYQTGKGKLAALLGTRFSPALSEDQNMFAAGARKLYDAGNARFERKKAA